VTRLLLRELRVARKVTVGPPARVAPRPARVAPRALAVLALAALALAAKPTVVEGRVLEAVRALMLPSTAQLSTHARTALRRMLELMSMPAKQAARLPILGGHCRCPMARAGQSTSNAPSRAPPFLVTAFGAPASRMVPTLSVVPMHMEHSRWYRASATRRSRRQLRDGRRKRQTVARFTYAANRLAPSYSRRERANAGIDDENDLHDR
jgi:hypothetical protein